MVITGLTLFIVIPLAGGGFTLSLLGVMCVSVKVVMMALTVIVYKAPVTVCHGVGRYRWLGYKTVTSTCSNS